MKLGSKRMQNGFELQNLELILASCTPNQIMHIELGSNLFHALRISNRIIIKTSHVIGWASANLIFAILDERHNVQESVILQPNEFKIL